MFLDGRHDELSRELEGKMKDAAREMRFELAAVYRDQLRAIEKVREEQRVVTVDDVDRDVLGLYREGELVELALLHVRAGKLADVATFSLKQAEIPDEEIVAAFLAQHYGGVAREAGGRGGRRRCRALLVPDEIILPCEPEGVAGIAEWLARARRAQGGARCCRSAGTASISSRWRNDNARHAFAEKRRQSDDVQERLRELQERLRLPTLPRRIECCDISHLGGGDTVGRRRRDEGRGARQEALPHVQRARAWPDGARARRRAGTTTTARCTRCSRGASGARVKAATEAARAPARTRRGRERDASEEDGGLGCARSLRGRRRARAARGRARGGARPRAARSAHRRARQGARERRSARRWSTASTCPGRRTPSRCKSSTTSLFFLARLRDEAHRFSNRARDAPRQEAALPLARSTT